LDACLDIVARFHPDPKKIKKISIRSSNFTINLLTTPLDRKLRPKTAVDAQFSMPYQTASAIIRGNVDIDTFTEKCFTDPLALELVEKIEWHIDEEFERRYPAAYSCAVTVTMDDGKEFTSVIDNPKGDYRNPMTQDEIVRKFSDLARIEITDERKINKIITFIHHLEEVGNVNELFSIVNG
jgi:2-methylcitrate dehydratase PrpD